MKGGSQDSTHTAYTKKSFTMLDSLHREVHKKPRLLLFRVRSVNVHTLRTLPSFHRAQFNLTRLENVTKKKINNTQLKSNSCWANAGSTASKVKFNDAE